MVSVSTVHPSVFTSQAPTSTAIGFLPTHLTLINIDLTHQQSALGVDHRSTQLVQHGPRRLVSGQTELALL